VVNKGAVMETMMYYKGKAYPICVVDIADVHGGQSCPTYVGEDALWQAIEVNFHKGRKEEVEIDNSIMYYLPDGFIKTHTYGEIINKLKEELT
jgi:hypothetical protein